MASTRKRGSKPNSGAHLRGQHQRSSYLGYDCYMYGPMLGTRKIRCVIRTHRVPVRIHADIRTALPAEFFWPTPDHTEAHRCIDALFLLDVTSLRQWVKLYPDHNFGLDPYIEFCDRWIAAQRRDDQDRGRSNRPIHAPEFERVQPHHPEGGQLRPQASTSTQPARPSGASPTSRFPAWVVASEPLRTLRLGSYELRLAVIYFGAGHPALRMEVWSPSHDIKLSRVYCELDTGEYEVIEHYPGRYRGAGLDPHFLAALLDSDVAVTERRRTILDDPRVKAAKEAQRRKELDPLRDEQAHAKRIAAQAREIHAAGRADEPREPEPAQEEPFDPTAPFGAHLMKAGVTR